jgi:hypothetical protein
MHYKRMRVVRSPSTKCRMLERLAIFLSIVLCGAASAAHPQSVQTVGVDVENDYFDFWRAPDRRSDDNYTQGIHLRASLGDLPSWAKQSLTACRPAVVFGSDSSWQTCAEGSISIGQELYTPTNDAPRPIPGERPYAALLFVDLTREAVSTPVLRTLTVRIGATGPPALGKATQEWFHRQVSGFREPLGWDHQVASQLIFFLKYDYRRAVFDKGWPLRLIIAPQGGLTLGNLATGAKVGIDAAIGHNAPHLWKSEAERNSFFRVYLVSGVEGEWVGYSLILRGNTAETRGLVRVRHLVPQWYTGVNVALYRLTLGFKSTSRGQEYQTGPPQHTWGQISFSYEFY